MQREQFKKWGHYSRLLWPVFLVLVAGCGSMGQQGMHHDDPWSPNIPVDHPVREISSMNLMVPGGRINDVVKSKDTLESAIKDLAHNDGMYGDNLKDLVDQLKDSNLDENKNAPGFKGVGGPFAHAAMDITIEALEPATGHFDPGKKVVLSMEGQIIGYEFTPSSTDPMEGNGKLVVITAVTRVAIGQGNPQPKTVGYKWEIHVENNGFKVKPKQSDYDQPFDVGMTFSDEMLLRIHTLGFEYKLWAEGTDIKVKNVWRKQSFKWEDVDNNNYWGNPRPNQGKWKRLYQSDPDSCIDMMFVEAPPETLDDLNGPPWYCLGRCKHPAIVNSR